MLIYNIQRCTTIYNNGQQYTTIYNNNLQQSTICCQFDSYPRLFQTATSRHNRQRNAQAMSPWQRSSNASPVTSKTGIGFFTHIAVSMLCLVPYATSLHGSVRRLRCTTYLARHGGFQSLGDPKRIRWIVHGKSENHIP